MRRRYLIMAAGVLAVLCIGWSLVGPWAAAFPLRPDHYEVTLFGVSHISDLSPTATRKTCGWNDAVAPCFPAADEAESYALLARARWLVLAGLGMALVGLSVLRFSTTPPGAWTAFPFAVAGVLVGA